MPDRLQQPREGIAVGGVAAAADVEGAGRVGGGPLDQDSLGRRYGPRPVAAGHEQAAERPLEPGVGEEGLTNPGPATSTRLRLPRFAEPGSELGPQPLGNGPRVVASAPASSIAALEL